LIRKYNTVIMI